MKALDATPDPLPNPLGGLLDCKPVDCPNCGFGEFPKNPNLVTVRAVVHFMETSILQSRRDMVLDDQRHLVAPRDHTSLYWIGEKLQIPENERPLKQLLGGDGLVNQIWDNNGQGIHVSLIRGEICTYGDEKRPVLRLETKLRSGRDSIYVPDPSISLTPAPSAELFRSINRLFTTREPGILHIVTWWSVAESESEDRNATDVQGYSRAAGRGGPAVWVSTQLCVDDPESYEECSRLLAHEIGHALGLHHVQPGDVSGDVLDNLMYKQYTGSCLEPWQLEEARNEARRLLNSR